LGSYDAWPCETGGLLRRRPVAALSLTHVGTESNRLEEVEAGLVHDPDEIYTEYEDPAHAPWRSLVVPVLRQMPRRLIMEGRGLARRTITAVRNSHGVPHPQTREALTHLAANFAREQLQAAGKQIPDGDLEACAAYRTLNALRTR
jgi:hypothetical protein